LNASGKVCHRFFQRTVTLLQRSYAAIELGVRELDHGLRLGEPPLNLGTKMTSRAIQLFIDLRGRPGEEIEALLHPLEGHIEVPAGLRGMVARRFFSSSSATI
jgi:hypothetical protein